MAEYRSIHNHIWEDSWFSNLSTEAKLLWIYLITNRRASISGIYEIQLKFIIFESGINEPMVTEILTEFQQSGKLVYVDDIIWIYKLRDYQCNNSPKLLKYITQDIKKLKTGPVLNAYCEHYGYPIDTLSIPYPCPIDTVSAICEENSIEISEYPIDTLSIPYRYPNDNTNITTNTNININTNKNTNKNQTTPLPPEGEVVVDFSNALGEVSAYFQEALQANGANLDEHAFKILQAAVDHYGVDLVMDALYALKTATGVKRPLSYFNSTLLRMKKEDAEKVKQRKDEDSEPTPYYPTVEELEADRRNYLEKQGMPLPEKKLSKEEKRAILDRTCPEIAKKVVHLREARDREATERRALAAKIASAEGAPDA